MTEGSDRMRDLLADLLAYTEIRVRREEPLEMVDLNLVLANVCKNLDGAIHESGACVKFDRLPHALVHRRHIQSVFQNLIGNALKYRAEAAPVIEVTAGLMGGDLRFEVRDNGIGIEPEYHAQVFEAFRRLHGRGIPGTGIGLSICQRVIERYGGKIGVESQPGVGSTFWFTLPQESPG